VADVAPFAVLALILLVLAPMVASRRARPRA
jgi:hypothetical protein